MGLLERTMRNEMRHRMLYGRRRRRTGMWGSPYGYGWGRPRRRSSVHVTGCCLPIPCGVVTAGALAAALATRRWRG